MTFGDVAKADRLFVTAPGHGCVVESVGVSVVFVFRWSFKLWKTPGSAWTEEIRGREHFGEGSGSESWRQLENTRGVLLTQEAFL